MIDEVGEHLRAAVADRDDGLGTRDDPYRHGLVGHTLPAAVHGDAEDGQQPVVLALRSGALVDIGDVGEEFAGDA